MQKLPEHTTDPTPLFVDLDGTLLKTDLLAESALVLAKQSPSALLCMPIWLMGGRARLKAEIAARVSLECDTLPLQREFHDYLQSQAAKGRSLYLATASDRRLAQPLADRVGVFRAVIASDGKRNMRDVEKLAAILAETNCQPFDYAGNARADYPIWQRARRAIVVNPDAGVADRARTLVDVEWIFEDRPPAWRLWLKQARLYQWMKNLLIGVPVLTAHTFDRHSLLATATAFLAFGLVASATYILNDLLDLSSDRRHPHKRARPLAAGNISIVGGIVAMLILLAAGLLLGVALSPGFLLVLLTYLCGTFAYSMYFKTYMLIDVILLAGLYSLRIVAGAVAIQVDVSSWLLAFSVFTFLSLALVKRCVELIALEKLGQLGTRGRDYRVGDTGVVMSMGIAAGYISVLVLALYVDSPFVREHYRYPRLMWLLCPLMLYWVSRLWMKTRRGELHHDPLLFSLRDRGSWIIFVAMIVIALIAS